MKMKKRVANFIVFGLIVILIGCGQQLEPQVNQGSSLTHLSDNQQISNGGPAPYYLLMTAKPQQEEYKQEDVVDFVITIKNVWNEPLQILNNPNIMIGPATVSTNEYVSIAVPDLGNKTIKPGETITTSAAWKQRGEPGLYQVQFGDIDLGNTKLSGGGSRFFIKYPADKVLLKTLKTDSQMKLPTENGELTFKLKSIEMDEHETRVYFEFLTELDAPMGFQISLAGSNGNINAYGVEQSQPQKGIIAGVAKFNPTTNEVTKLRIILSDWTVVYTGIRSETVKGPWTMDIPIK